MSFCLCVGERLCLHVFVCASSPLEGLLCLVCMISVPTTAPMFAAVVVETSASGCSSLYFFVTCSDGYSTHSRALLPSSHPPLLSLTGCSQHKPSPRHPFMLSLSVSQRSSSPSLSPHTPPHSLFFIRGCSLLPSFIPLFPSLSIYLSQAPLPEESISNSA